MLGVVLSKLCHLANEKSFVGVLVIQLDQSLVFGSVAVLEKVSI
jgi:hypothetical protein